MSDMMKDCLQRNLERNITTFQTHFGAMRLVILPIDWTNFIPIFYDDRSWSQKFQITVHSPSRSNHWLVPMERKAVGWHDWFLYNLLSMLPLASHTTHSRWWNPERIWHRLPQWLQAMQRKWTNVLLDPDLSRSQPRLNPQPTLSCSMRMLLLSIIHLLKLLSCHPCLLPSSCLPFKSGDISFIWTISDPAVVAESEHLPQAPLATTFTVNGMSSSFSNKANNNISVATWPSQRLAICT